MARAAASMRAREPTSTGSMRPCSRPSSAPPSDFSSSGAITAVTRRKEKIKLDRAEAIEPSRKVGWSKSNDVRTTRSQV